MLKWEKVLVDWKKSCTFAHRNLGVVPRYDKQQKEKKELWK